MEAAQNQHRFKNFTDYAERRNIMDITLQSILEAALQQGIWAALYIYLFFRMLKQNEDREAKYQNIIDNLSGKIQENLQNMLIKEISRNRI